MDKPPARSPLVRSFERHLRSTNRAESTIATYLFGLRQAEAFLRERPDRAQCTDERERPDRAQCTDERERAAIRPTTLEESGLGWPG